MPVLYELVDFQLNIGTIISMTEWRNDDSNFFCILI